MSSNPFGSSNTQNASSNNINRVPANQQFPPSQVPTQLSAPFVSYPPPSLFPNQYVDPLANQPPSNPFFTNYPPPSLFNNQQQPKPTSILPPPIPSPSLAPQQSFTFNTTAQQSPLFPQPFQQSPFNFQQQNSIFGNTQAVHPIRLLKAKEAGKKVVALIVTFHGVATYDALFTQVQQKTLQGTQVLVYSCEARSIDIIIKAFEGKQQQRFKGDESGKLALEIVAHSKEVDPDCVVFNWECSSDYSNEQFPEGKNHIMTLLKILITKGHMAMFSDFSLKALINSWDAQLLGKNPFKRTGVTYGTATLKFKPGVLRQCPSAQLQLLGELVEEGRCSIHCAGNTIKYTVDKESIDNRYVLEILTICLTTQSLPPTCLHEVNGELGEAGHVLIRYPAGGMILTSMGHWIELMKIDPSQKKLFEVAEREYGATFAQQMQNQYYQMNPIAQAQFRSQNATTFIQNSAPCQNMNRKPYS